MVNFDFDVLKIGSNLVTSIKKIAHSIGMTVKHRSKGSRVTLERAVEDFFCGKTGPGDAVSIEGFLSRYILTHRPAFYSHYAHRVSKHSIRPDVFNPLINKVSLEVEAILNQFPIQAIPPIQVGQELVYVYFLYSPDISSFLLQQDSEQISKKEAGEDIESLLNLSREIRPILVVSPKPLYQEMEKIVRLTGIVKDADEKILESFFHDMSGSQQIILSNTIRPFNEKIGALCLDLRDSAEIEVIDERGMMPAILYIESHIENITQLPDYQNIMGVSLPGAFPGMHWVSHNDKQVSWGLSSSEVFIASIDFSRFAFFVETNLGNSKNYQDSLKNLHGFAEVFRKSVQNFARKNHNIELKNKYDFLFDYSKSKLFHPDGVLVSKEIEILLAQHPELAAEVDWLRTSAQ